MTYSSTVLLRYKYNSVIVFTALGHGMKEFNMVMCICKKVPILRYHRFNLFLDPFFKSLFKYRRNEGFYMWPLIFEFLVYLKCSNPERFERQLRVLPVHIFFSYI